jgi:hypothetical protein
MIRKLSGVFFSFLFLITVLSGFYLVNSCQKNIVYGQEKIFYTLPYPGILPDHPLYFIKAIRDKMMDVLTRDNIKKANLYLLFSDKRINMAIMLSKKGKNKLAVTTFAKGEKYFLKIPDLLLMSKKQGVAPSSELIENIKTANAKHREIAMELLKVSPAAQTRTMEDIIRINEEIKVKLKKL